MKFKALKPRQIFRIGDSVGMVVVDPLGLNGVYVDWDTGRIRVVDPCTEVALIDHVTPVLEFDAPNPFDDDDCYPHVY